jgi:type IV pilus assembly protein PilF
MTPSMRPWLKLSLFLSLAALQGCQSNPPLADEVAQSGDRLADIKTQLGIEYMRENQDAVALRRLLEAIDLDPNYAPAHNALGLLYTKLGQDGEAEGHYRRALRSAPNDPSALNNYGMFLCQRGRVDEAIGMFAKAAANPLYETPEVSHSNAGTCLMQAGRLAQAEQNLRAALEENGRLAPALVQMAELSLELNRPLPARGYLQRYLEVARHTSRSLWLGIRIERALGDRDAEGSYALLLEKNFPDSAETRLLLESRRNGP